MKYIPNCKDLSFFLSKINVLSFFYKSITRFLIDLTIFFFVILLSLTFQLIQLDIA